MILTPPIGPMLAETRHQLPPDGALPGSLQFEQKADGFRAIVFARSDIVLVQSRNGADLAPAFPEIARAAAGVGEDLVLDGELVVPLEGCLDFAALEVRALRRGRTAAQAAAEHPAYLIVFDVLEREGKGLLELPYQERRAILEDLFARGVLGAPFTLCPATRDRATAQEWLDPAWGSVGVEGVVVKGLGQTYQPHHRAWIKVRSRITAEAVIGAVTGSCTAPATLLLGRYSTAGTLKLVARTTPLAPTDSRDLARRLTPADPQHPWHDVRFTASSGTRSTLDHHPVQPDQVAEYLADTAVASGIHRHPVRLLRLRDDLTPDQLPRLDF
ncbi:ATP-dependent DNA ligase [Streptomyces sp. NPDC005017]|uniref:ATP-dependent DNA ligase n=1 Tax=Streptomyces sp. NPDC005017 TaxID=3364706 RepID=UPI0036C23554